MSALSDWAKALYEQLQDCPNNETGWEIIEEAGRKLILETEIRVKEDLGPPDIDGPDWRER